ncbi:hypothetical protein G6N74_16235 [Mesorhizobium sp. CGMCC 1.15528]|uniref:LPXTG cell wall anchor domain-containing protein n=1 Tax=Mesorhizobium zhangyense TaxID=1776730 RepID=A0A7C9R959_9HYPH|nr:hypothetical protein [Mesorhizobium zhangyense]NGN42618.1 hypothetical protein [Mesorhizobium zhangyense]
MSGFRSVLFAAVLGLMTVAPALAEQPPDRGPTPGLGWGPGGSKGYAVPGPLAGVGLPIVAAVGCLVWLRMRNRKKNKE